MQSIDDIAPTTLEGYHLNRSALVKITEMVKNIDQLGRKGMVLCGPCGVGKSTLATLSLHKYGRVAKIFDIPMFESTADLTLRLTACRDIRKDLDGRTFGIIFDGLDYMTTEIADAIAKSMAHILVPVFFICNNQHTRFARVFIHKYPVVKFFPISPRDMIPIIMHIYATTKRANIKADPSASFTLPDTNNVLKIATASCGDIRRCFYLTMFSLVAPNAATQTYKDQLGNLVVNPFDLTLELFKPANTYTEFSERMGLLDMASDRNQLCLFVQENYLNRLSYVADPNLSSDTLCVDVLERLGGCADTLSLAERFEAVDYAHTATIALSDYWHALATCASVSCGPTLTSGTLIDLSDGANIRFPAKINDHGERKRIQGLVSTMRATKTGMGYSPVAVTCDLYPFLIDKKNCQHLKQNDTRARAFMDTLAMFDLLAYGNSDASNIELQRIEEQKGYKRACAPTFAPVDHVASLVETTINMLASTVDVEVPAPAIVHTDKKQRVIEDITDDVYQMTPDEIAKLNNKMIDKHEGHGKKAKKPQNHSLFSYFTNKKQ